MALAEKISEERPTEKVRKIVLLSLFQRARVGGNGKKRTKNSKKDQK